MFLLVISKLTLDTLEYWMKIKKKTLSVFISNFEAYTRYSWVADEEQKTGLRCFFLIIDFWIVLLKGAKAFFFIFFIGALLKKVWETLI